MPELDTIVLDASAVLVYFWAEPGYRTVVARLKAGRAVEGSLRIHRITLMEVCARLLRAGMKRDAARQQLQALLATGIRVVEPEEESLMAAAELRASFDMPLLDAIVAQTALDAAATVLTADPDFRRVEKRVRVAWVR